MSFNQPRAERSDSSNYRKTRRSGRFSSRKNNYSASTGKGGAGGAATPPASNFQPNLSFSKRFNNAQGGQPRASGSGVSSNSDPNSASAYRPAPNASYLQPPIPAPSPPATGIVVKKTCAEVVQKALSSQAANVNPDPAPHATPAKAPGDASKSFPIQFGSINPGALNVMQIPVRTSSAPANLVEQQRDQACRDSLKQASSFPIPSVPKQRIQRSDVVTGDQLKIGEAHQIPKARKDIQVSSPAPASQIQKAPGHIISGVSRPMSFHQQLVPVQFGGPTPQLQSQGVANASLPMPMPLPMGSAPHLPHTVYVSGLNPHPHPHPTQGQGILHQGQGFNFTSQMGPQMPPQLGNIGMGAGPQFPQLQPSKFVGSRKAVKITHPETHEELRLENASDSFGRVSSQTLGTKSADSSSPGVSTVDTVKDPLPTDSATVDLPGCKSESITTSAAEVVVGSFAIEPHGELNDIYTLGEPLNNDDKGTKEGKLLDEGAQNDDSISKTPSESACSTRSGVMNQTEINYNVKVGTNSLEFGSLEIVEKGKEGSSDDFKKDNGLLLSSTSLAPYANANEITSDLLDALMVPNVNAYRESYSSPGRVVDRSPGGPRRGVIMGDEDKWNKIPGPLRMHGYGGNFRPGQGGNHGVLRNPRGSAPAQYFGGILSGTMQSMGSHGGVQRSNFDADRWQRATGFQKVLIPSPQTCAPIMHKAERKYQVGIIIDEEQAKQRQLKAILNKRTPQNFEKLFEQVIAVNIDNVYTLVGFVSQIYDKALMEPTFCEMYANFCYRLAGELPDFSDDNEKITFKRLLVNKCQEEFERGEREQEEDDRADAEGEVKQSPEEREEKRIQARRRMLGNIRLIGELYKKRMLTERIMHECIKKLLGQYHNPDEEDIESLCILMSTIGEMIDHPKAKERMDAYFDMMSRLSNNMKLSSSIRFMLKDAIDLRKNKWQQRRKVEGPKKIDEVHRDAAQERQAQAGRLARGGPGSNSSGRNRKPMDFSSEGSSMLTSQMSGYRGLQSQPGGFGVQDARIDRHSFE